MNILGIYGKAVGVFYAKCIKCIDSQVSLLLRRILGDERHFIMTNRLVHESRLWGRYSLFHKKYNGMKTVVLFYDGSFSSPGLADMLRAICSVYQWCKTKDLSFKLFCRKPFNMSDYLVPNEYDWSIDAKDLDYSNSKPYAIFLYNKFYGEEKQEMLQKYCLNRILKCQYKQLHIYTNLCCYDAFFSNNFHELFKVEDELERELIAFQKEIGYEYITISFRFTQLLGDLKDSFAEPLPDNEKQQLIIDCIDSIKPIIDKNNVSITIVTSDSKTFLKEVTKLPYVYLLPGEPDHINNSDRSKGAVRKAFWDTMMISRAKKAYMVRTPFMYTSGFAQRAAMIGNIPFEEIVI